METSGDSDNSNNSNSNNNSSNSSNSDNNNNIATPRSHSGSIKHYNKNISNIRSRYCG